MAEALVSFGVQKLWELLNQEYEQFQGVDDQVTELKHDLNLLNSFLKDADAKKHKSAVVRNCVEEIKEIIYDAEDIIEKFLLEDELGKKSGFRKRVRRFAFTIVDRKELASDIGGISKRISKVIRDMQSFGVQQMIADKGYTQPLHDRQSHMRQTFSQEYEINLVGLEANIKKLVGLVVEKNNVQVVSITGMGGLGKTTLARQVFNHAYVKRKFDGLAWVCVSQDFTRMNVWQTILRSLRPSVEENKILEMTESTLQGELFRLLETSKPLIVLDDIWKEEDWNLIKPIFPPEKGWKVLLTTRNESVVMRQDATYINFKQECLTIDDTWKLFQSIAFPRKDISASKQISSRTKHSSSSPIISLPKIFALSSLLSGLGLRHRKFHPSNDLDVSTSQEEFKVDEEMEEMGKEMIKHCGGLPLAVKVLGGLLAAKYTLHDWKRISENIGSHIVGGRTDLSDDNNISFNHVLSLSFEELPSYLKHCFLYLAHFPEDHTISVEMLSYYWAAEGISKNRHYDGETIRDIGDSNIEEMVLRNMVISGRDVTTLRYETCHLHDMMREFCLLKAKEENFLQIASTHPSTANSQSPLTSRRFVSQYHATLDVERDINNPKLRSLVIVDVKDIQQVRYGLSGSSFKRLELLRVLDLFRANFIGGKLPSGIGKLIHLRYLSLKDAYVTHLPASLGNLLLLIYLNMDISNIGYIILVPNVLMGMQELRYLALPRRMDKKTKLELSNLVKLETLKNFSTENNNLEDLRGMTRMRSLGIKLTKNASAETLSASIGGLRHLEHLYIEDSKRNVEDGIVLDFSHLKRLSLNMYMPKLPKEQHFPSHLTTLTLRNCGLVEDPMPILEKLRQLKEVTLWSESFSGRRMLCSGGGFPQLQKLVLHGLCDLEEWIVEEGSMPLLHTLLVLSCHKLKEVPNALRFNTSLRELFELNMKLFRGEDL